MDSQNVNIDFKSQFAELLSSTYISSNASSEEVSEKWTDINELLFKNIPQKLFRFRTCNTDSIISLQSGTISLCTANSFKDKYDSLIYVNKEEIIDGVTKFINSSMMDEMCKSIENGSAIPIFESLFGKEKVDQMLEENLNLSSKERKQKFYENAKQMLSHIIGNIDSQIDYIRNDRLTKIACFTEDIQSLYMWDSYGYGYKGFALEYDFREFHLKTCHSCPKQATCNELYKNYTNLFPILYSDKRYDATLNVVNLICRNVLNSWGINNPLPQIDQLYWYKSYLYKNEVDYGHEKEWRMITRCPNQQDSDFAIIPDYKTLKAIYYGPNMEKRYKDFLRIIAKQMDLLEYEVTVDSSSPRYDLKITQI